MIGVIVDHDIVAVPKPVVGVGKIERGDAEVEAAKPETAGIATLDAPPVSPAEAAVEAAVLPGVIEMESGILPPIVVAHPLTVVVDVRGFGVTVTVAIGALVTAFAVVTIVRVAVISGRTMFGDVSTAHVVMPVATSVIVIPVLGKDGDRKNERYCKSRGE